MLERMWTKGNPPTLLECKLVQPIWKIFIVWRFLRKLKNYHMIQAFCWQESYDKPRQRDEKWRHYSVDKGLYSQSYGLPSGHIQLWEMDCKEGRAPKNWCLQTVVMEKAPESPLYSKEIKPVNLKGDQSWILIGRTHADAAVFCSSDENSQLTKKVPDAGKDWGQKEKRASEDQIAEWLHWCNGHELGQTLEDGERQEGLACCGPWGHKESDTTGDWITTTVIQQSHS